MGQDTGSYFLRHGRVQTLVDPLTRPNFDKVKKSVTDVSEDVTDTSSDMLVIAIHFSPLNVNQTYLPGRTVDSPCTLHHNEILQSFG